MYAHAQHHPRTVLRRFANTDVQFCLKFGHQIQAPVVSKKASELWRNLAKEDRLHWDKEAAKEKLRYIAEKELYKGPVSSKIPSWGSCIPIFKLGIVVSTHIP